MRVCKLTLTTSKTTNPFSDQLMDELTSFFKDVNQNEQIKSLILYGGEENVFQQEEILTKYLNYLPVKCKNNRMD